MAKSGGTLKASFSTRAPSTGRPVPTPYVRRQDRIFPIPATKEIKPAKVPEQDIPPPPKMDVGKPIKPARVPALKIAKTKFDTKGLK